MKEFFRSRAKLAGAAGAVLAALAAGAMWLHRRHKPAPGPPEAPAAVPAAPGAEQFAKLAALRDSSRAAVAGLGKTLSGVDPKFKGVRAFGAALTGLDAAKPADAPALTVKNPDFWRAVMEMVPQDPSVLLSAAGLYAMKGELGRADAWLLFAAMGMGPDWTAARDGMRAAVQRARDELGAAVKKGVALHDAKKYAEAVAAYDAVLAGAPRDAWALYEKSFSWLSKDEAGTAAAREEIYKTIREIDPFYLEAYQGSDPDVIQRKLPALLSGVVPFVSDKDRSVDGLAKFAEGCEKADIHDFAAIAYWKLTLLGKDRDEALAHYFFNLKRLGLGAFVESVAKPPLLKAVAELEASASAPLTRVQASIAEYGLYRMREGKAPELLQSTATVRADGGVAFGYLARIDGLGSREAKGWRVVTEHPRMDCPDEKGTRSDSDMGPTQKSGGGFSAWILYRFDEPCEMLQGRWTLKIVKPAVALRMEEGKSSAARGENVVVGKDFEVLAPPSAPAPRESSAAPLGRRAPFSEESSEAREEQRKALKAAVDACSLEIGLFCNAVKSSDWAAVRCLRGRPEVRRRLCVKALDDLRDAGRPPSEDRDQSPGDSE